MCLCVVPLQVAALGAVGILALAGAAPLLPLLGDVRSVMVRHQGVAGVQEAAVAALANVAMGDPAAIVEFVGAVQTAMGDRVAVGSVQVQWRVVLYKAPTQHQPNAFPAQPVYPRVSPWAVTQCCVRVCACEERGRGNP
jgi:hypothetical protein